MLKLIMEELKQNGIDEKQFININFENLINRELTTADKLHKYILKRASEIKNKCYIFLDEIQEVKDWEKCINSLRVNEKYYIADHGIREAIFESNQRDINQIFENIIYLELLRKGYNVRVGKIENLEIDFVCTKGNEKLYIQVTYLLASPETIEREFTSLQKINDNYPKYVCRGSNLEKAIQYYSNCWKPLKLV